jgi:hypothetical protein
VVAFAGVGEDGAGVDDEDAAAGAAAGVDEGVDEESVDVDEPVEGSFVVPLRASVR